MIREKLIAAHHAAPTEFRWRSHEVTRIEGLSDGVFGFAIALLIVSVEVPKTSAELLATMRGFPAFGVTFLILFLLWRQQFLFFRRYGLQDDFSIGLNGLLLFVVLFFMYPLKFTMSSLMGRALAVTAAERAVFKIPAEDRFWLFASYGFGLLAVTTVFALLYGHAYRKREELALTEIEVFDTRQSMDGFGAGALIGLSVIVSQVASSILRSAPHSIWLDLAPPALVFGAVAAVGLHAQRSRRRRRQLVQRLGAATGEPAARSE